MAVIAVTGRKGGGGKTTLCAHLCGEFASMGHAVAALDADPQQSLLRWAHMGEGLLRKSVRYVEASSLDGFRAQVDEAAGNTDVVLVDTPPALADTALWAHLVADLAIIPVNPSPLDIFAAGETLQVVREASARRRSRKPRALLVPNRVRASTTTGRDLTQALESLGVEVTPGIGLREAAAVAALHGLTLVEFAPSSLARQEFQRVAKALEDVLWIRQGTLLVRRPG